MTITIPNTLSDKQIKEFQTLWKEAYSETLSKEEAQTKALFFISIISTLLTTKYQL
jgi:hypothetical protein